METLNITLAPAAQGTATAKALKDYFHRLDCVEDTTVDSFPSAYCFIR